MSRLTTVGNNLIQAYLQQQCNNLKIVSIKKQSETEAKIYYTRIADNKQLLCHRIARFKSKIWQ
jgi:hypothetical protein